MSRGFSEYDNKEPCISVPVKEVKIIDGKEITSISYRIKNFSEYLRDEAIKTGDVSVFEPRQY